MADDNTNWTNSDDFKPGSMGCHEALHMTSFFGDAIERELLEHPAIKADPDWLLEVERVVLALRRLYQLIGSKHLSA